MTGFSFIVLSVLLFLFSVYLGFQIGCWAGDQAVTSRDYWKMNIAAVVIGVVGSVIISPLPLLYSAVIGLLAGCIVGMKMAFGEVYGSVALPGPRPEYQPFSPRERKARHR